MSEQENKPRTLGLDDIQANALFAWQHGLLYELDDNTLNAVSSVLEKARDMDMSYAELRQVPIDEGWISDRLLKLSKILKGQSKNR